MLKEEENRFGMTVIEKNVLVPVNSLKINQDYQRIKDRARVANVKKSMIKCAQFLPDKSITVNQNNEIVDGQHRYWAAKELGWEVVPITKYFFSNKKNEAAFFTHINGFDQRLKTHDFWYALYLSGDELAEFLYRLEESPLSALKEKIAIRGKLTKESKWTISNVLQIIVFAVTGSSDNWSKRNHELLVSKIQTVGRGIVFERVNEFVIWFEDIFGTKKENSLAHYVDSFRAILFFYSLLKRNEWHNKKETISKMKQFRIDQNFITAPLIGKKQLLVGHYNGQKKKNIIEYSAIK
jgi:hypothetical protein